MNGGCFPFAVEYLYLFGTFPVHTAVKPFGMYSFGGYLKAVTVDVFTDGEGGLHRGRLMGGGNVQAEVLHVYAFASLAVLERIHDETLVKAMAFNTFVFLKRSPRKSPHCARVTIPCRKAE